MLVPALHGGKSHELRISLTAESDDVVLECLVLERGRHLNSPSDGIITHFSFKGKSML
jgi:hypothetical protein